MKALFQMHIRAKLIMDFFHYLMKVILYKILGFRYLVLFYMELQELRVLRDQPVQLDQLVILVQQVLVLRDLPVKLVTQVLLV